MQKLVIALFCSSVAMAAHAQRHDVYIHDQTWQQHSNQPFINAQAAVIDPSSWGDSFAEGQNIRKAWDARKARKKHDQAMQELGTLDLNDNNAVMSFAKTYPDSIDKLKDMLQLHKQLSN